MPVPVWKHRLLVSRSVCVFSRNIIWTKEDIFVELVPLISTNLFLRTEPECEIWGSRGGHLWNMEFSIVIDRRQRFVRTYCLPYQTGNDVWRGRQQVLPKCRASLPDYDKKISEGTGLNFNCFRNYIKRVLGYLRNGKGTDLKWVIKLRTNPVSELCNSRIQIKCVFLGTVPNGSGR